MQWERGRVRRRGRGERRGPDRREGGRGLARRGADGRPSVCAGGLESRSFGAGRDAEVLRVSTFLIITVAIPALVWAVSTLQ